MRTWLVVVACASCASPSDRVAGAPLVTVETAGGPIVVATGPDSYTVTFAPTPPYLPTSLSYAGVELLVGGPLDPDAPRGVGFRVAPAYEIAGGSSDGAALGSSAVAVDSDGSAVAQVSSAWTAALQCHGAGGSIAKSHAETTFTLFPGGRLVRSDVYSPLLGTGVLDPTDQPCGAGSAASNWSVSSLWTFAAPAGTPTDQMDTVCIPYAGFDLVVDYSRDSTATSHFTDATDGSALPLIYDWAHGDANIQSSDHYTLTTELRLVPNAGESACAALSMTPATPPTIDVHDRVSDQHTTATVQSDGIYDGGSGSSALELTAKSGGIPASWAISLGLAGVTHARVVGATGPLAAGAYGDEVDPATGRYLFWFRDALAVGQTITIEPD